MKEIRVKAIIFDYGNTIAHEPFFDVLKLKMSDFQKAIEKFGYKFKKKEIINSWTKADEEVDYPHITHFAQELPVIEEALKRLGVKRSDRLKLSKEFLRIYREGYRKLYQNNPRKKEIKRVLDKLKKKGKKLAVFSDGRKYDVGNALKFYGISKYFKFILSSEELGVEKPNPLVFKTLLKRIKESAGDVVHVGDNPVKDVQAAKQAGLKTILYIPPKKYRRSVPWRNYNIKINVKPDAVIKKFSNLERILI